MFPHDKSIFQQADVSSTAVIKFKEPALPVPFRKLDEVSTFVLCDHCDSKCYRQ